MITVILADDHTLIRDALCYLLEAQGDIKVMATAADGQEAVEQAMRLCPDIAVLDISMPRMDGIEAARRICTICTDTRILMLTIFHTAEHVRHALKAGAAGFVLKDSAGQELVDAVRALHNGDNYFSSKIAGVGENYINQKGNDSPRK
ncbi:MAG TPA: response regulator transcription factor [Anaerolineales bacterium]|nr:response regulator transcription factor [Anaerolineales bacterium]